MARRRWTTPALRDLRRIIEWTDEHWGPTSAGTAAADIREAARRATSSPEIYARVGTVEPSLDALPHNVRRVLTRRQRYVLYYRHHADHGEVEILAIRGAGQLPPSPEELGA